MIPILYEKTETAFVSNGLGRLRDCLSCIVTEERNGIYECDFEYPTTGANYELIQVGRIVGVTHDETGDVQPFDIVSYEKPIDGIVAFHCVHISYRLTESTITGTNINSLSDAFTRIKNYAYPATPFTFTTDKTAAGYAGVFNGVPHTVRQTLGGIEGSLLDTYGGEYEFDKWNVILHSARGQMRDFTIRYGVNMLEFNEEYDITGCYNAVRPYWTDGQTVVVGDRQKSAAVTPTGRTQCIPLDVSDKFESKPTKTDVENMGMSVMNASNPTVPARSIEVSFVRLQDAGEADTYDTLLQCKLCDTINVIFPDFNSSGQFKIVRTEWNVLRGRYETMELGALSVSLAEALGIQSTLDKISNFPIDVEAGHVQIGGVHICFGSVTISAAANSYTETTVTLPHTYSAAPTVLTSFAARNAAARSCMGTNGGLALNQIYVGCVSTTARNQTVCWCTIGF